MPGGRLILPIDPENISFYKTIGCITPKLRLFKNVHFGVSLNEEREIIAAMKRDDDYLLIADPDRLERDSWQRALATDESSARGKIRVTAFSANELELEATVENESGLWLYYADAWHPAWKASVNDEEAPILRTERSTDP